MKSKLESRWNIFSGADVSTWLQVVSREGRGIYMLEIGQYGHLLEKDL